MEEPLCDFSSFKAQLTRMGYHIKQSQAYKPIQAKDVDINELRRMEFTDEGIFVIDEFDGSRRQVFLYKRRYHLEKYGKPRFHICKCSTIEEFIEAGRFKLDYRRANTESVSVLDWDNGDQEVIIDHLPICKNCVAVLREKYADVEMYEEEEYFNPDTGEYETRDVFIGPKIFKCKANSSAFAQFLREINEEDVGNEQQLPIDVDIRGYTRDWEEISYNFRKEHNFTCDKCGIEIPFDSLYLHTHHKNGIKTDNRPENLQCLCIRCHANIDPTHKANFSKGQKKKMLDDFNEQYPIE